MRFGNTLASIRRGIVVMAILGAVLGAVGLGIATTHDTLNRTWPMLIIMPLALPGLFLMACLPTLVFSIRIEEGKVKHLFLDRYVLSDYPLADFTRIQRWQRPWAAVIHFKRAKRIRFFGAHFRVLSEMEVALKQAKRKAGDAVHPTPDGMYNEPAGRQSAPHF